jgi:hypothetical protein
MTAPAPEGEGAVSATTTECDASADTGSVSDHPGGVSTPPVEITAPCVVDGMSDDVYHGDPVRGAESLSHSGMKTLATECPALYRYERDNGREAKRAFDLGHLAHGYALGVGQRIVVVDAKDWRSNAAKAERDEARAAGAVPVLKREDDAARAMGRSLRSNSRTGHLFEPGAGVTERALFWFDERFGFWRRAKLDLTVRLADGRLAVIDYKSREGKVSRTGISKALWEFSYYTQDPYYRDGLKALGIDEDPVFLFVFQQRSAPYFATVVEADAETKAWGRLKVDEGLDLYARCLDTGVWPDYMVDDAGQPLPQGEPLSVGLPRWADRELTDQYQSGRLDIA